MSQDVPPTIFGKYRILGRVAVGGMAEIYKARMDGIGGFQRTYAIKRILPHLTTHREFVDMLVDEARIAGLLSHANIVQTLDFGQVDGTYYIAMEYVDGPDLGGVLRRARERGQTLPVPHAVFIAIELLKGLEYAHNRSAQKDGQPFALNIVHRDISPGNVLISRQGEVKITDFGIAKASVKALETLAGVVKGRFDYMSPEQASGRGADARSDLFSTGVVIYEMLVGRNPFSRAREADTILAIRDGEYPPLSALKPDIPGRLEAMVARALRVDPGLRYQSATEMKDDLSLFFHEAGFIFSTDRLGSFVSDLFPHDEATPEPEPPRPAAPAPAPAPSRPARAPAPAPAPSLADAPDLPDDAAPMTFDDAATVIRRPEELEAEPVVTPTPAPSPAPRAARAPPTPPPAAAPAPRGLPLALWGVVLGLLLLAGSAGFFAGSHFEQSKAAPPARPISRGAELRFALPAGATLRVDGAAVADASPSASLAVTPSQPHQVEVALEGYAPMRAEFTLDQGEIQYILVEARELTPKTR